MLRGAQHCSPDLRALLEGLSVRAAVPCDDHSALPAFQSARCHPVADSAPSASVTPEGLLLDLREVLLPFATCAVGLGGTDQFDAITRALLATVTQQQPSPSQECLTNMTEAAADALSRLKELALRDALSVLDSPAGFQLIKALCAFMSDALGCSSPIHFTIRREMFRSQFCSLHSEEAEGSTQGAGLKALLRNVLAFFEENHSDVLELFNCESSSASSGCKKTSAVASGSFDIHLMPLPNDSGCSKHFGCSTKTFPLEVASDFKSIAGDAPSETNNVFSHA
jgi:hypothetical protein